MPAVFKGAAVPKPRWAQGLFFLWGWTECNKGEKKCYMIFSAKGCLQSLESRSRPCEKPRVTAHPGVTAPLSKWKQVFMWHCPSSWPASQLPGSKFPLFLFGKLLGFDAYACLCQHILQNMPWNGYKPRADVSSHFGDPRGLFCSVSLCVCCLR